MTLHRIRRRNGSLLAEQEADTLADAVSELVRKGVDFSAANLADADLSGAWMAGARLGGADLSRTDLTDALLCDADFSRSLLNGANCCGANLSGVVLRDADLFGVRLVRAEGILIAGPLGPEGEILYAVRHSDELHLFVPMFCNSDNFWGPVPDFMAALSELYGDTPVGNDYRAAVNFIKTCAVARDWPVLSFAGTTLL
jgi:hypothetical protein